MARTNIDRPALGPVGKSHVSQREVEKGQHGTRIGQRLWADAAAERDATDTSCTTEQLCGTRDHMPDGIAHEGELERAPLHKVCQAGLGVVHVHGNACLLTINTVVSY